MDSFKSYTCNSPFLHGITEGECDRKFLCSSPVGKPRDKGLTKNSRGDLLITCPIGLHKIPVTFLVDIDAQMSALKIDNASSCGITPSCKGILVDNFGFTQPQTTAKARCWLPREENAVETLMVWGKFPADLLGPNPLKGRSWTNTEGKI